MSRLVDPRAEQLVRQMSERLAHVAAFAREAEEMYDEVPEQSPRRQLTNVRRVAMRRPDRLVGDASGDALNRSFWYDGKVFAALDNERQVCQRRSSADGDRGQHLAGRPENAVTLKVTLASIPDGISYPASIVFSLPQRQLVVTITKSNYQKIAQWRSVDTHRSR